MKFLASGKGKRWSCWSDTKMWHSLCTFHVFLSKNLIWNWVIWGRKTWLIFQETLWCEYSAFTPQPFSGHWYCCSSLSFFNSSSITSDSTSSAYFTPQRASPQTSPHPTGFVLCKHFQTSSCPSWLHSWLIMALLSWLIMGSWPFIQKVFFILSMLLGCVFCGFFAKFSRLFWSFVHGEVFRVFFHGEFFSTQLVPLFRS